MLKASFAFPLLHSYGNLFVLEVLADIIMKWHVILGKCKLLDHVKWHALDESIDSTKSSSTCTAAIKLSPVVS